MNDSKLVNVTINGVPLQVPKGERIIESARRAGIDIPYFCYHPRLSMENGANCRMCLVEMAMPRTGPDGTVTLAKHPKPQTACSLPADEGMVVETETEAIVKARRGVLEFLLINHPLDCPVCDRGGECPLQNNTLHYGAGASRYIEAKRHYPKAYPLSEHVVLDRERCIQCARCTRFTQDISGDAQLDFLKRGADTQIGTFNAAAFSSLFSGNTIEICPVGALTSRDYRFRARPWDLATQKSICTECSNGCSIKLDHRDGLVLRVNGRVNEAVNEEWTCDRGKFGLPASISGERLTAPLLRDGDRFREVTWDVALGVVAEKLQAAGKQAAVLAGSKLANEDLYALQALCRGGLGSVRYDYRMGTQSSEARDAAAMLFGPNPAPTGIAGLEASPWTLVVGSDLAVEHPIVFLRLRKSWRFGKSKALEMVSSSAPANTHVGAFAWSSVRYADRGLPESLRSACSLLLAEMPGLTATPEIRAWAATGTPPADDTASRRMATALSTGPGTILVGEGALSGPDWREVLVALGHLAGLTGSTGSVNRLVSGCNDRGAEALGFGDWQPGTAGILAGAASGATPALWIAGADPVTQYHDPQVAIAALEQASFVVVSDIKLTATARMADVVLPSCSVAERDGTLTNVEGRVQRFWKAFEPRGSASPDWLIAARLLQRLGKPSVWFGWQDVLADMRSHVAAFGGVSLDALEKDGAMLVAPQVVD
ncbi:MAG: NADH-quinone oxidoreductase subunit NuoG [Armatimonadetes bacterium]|nr:NADH-quinone oxidoreductase subunit NuoG [Armatimonadota bacterium]